MKEAYKCISALIAIFVLTAAAAAVADDTEGRQASSDRNSDMLGASETGSAPPVITTEYLPGCIVGVIYSQALTATGDAVSWSFEISVHPPGLSFSTTGIISGTPELAGTYSITAKATNHLGTDTRTFLLIISAVPLEPSITTSSLPVGAIGTPYSRTLIANGTGPMTWSLLAGDLPDGLSLKPGTGEISGTPTVSGKFTFTVKVVSAVGEDTKVLSITVTTADGKEDGGKDSGSTIIILVALAAAIVIAAAALWYFRFRK